VSDDYDPCVTIEGAGPTIVLVPGMNGSGRLFYQQVPRLRERYRVVTYSLRDDAPTLEALADDLHQIVKQIVSPGELITLLGESFGGAVALTFALAYPEQVGALVILNSFPHFAPKIRLILASVGLRMLPWGVMGLIRHATAWRLHSRHTHRSEVKRFIELTTDATRTGYLNRLRLLRRYDVRDALPRLRPPVLFLAAEQDHLVPAVAQATIMAARVPRGTVQILDGHGHICLIAPDLDLAAIIEQWQTSFG
jgi:pimeloyl-ACP methyl ester carboxylesterase